MSTIVEVATKAGTFKTLLTAAKAAGLIETLNGKGPYTIFAPTDEAFAKLPKGTIEALLKDPKRLKQVLLYHVVAGKVSAESAAKLTSAKTLEGQEIKISMGDKGELGKKDPAFKRDPVKWHENLRINDAFVTKANIEAKNGVIHVINKVLLPK
jgi:uncharacterized surface protein with fasciclin (FAS1) repeats